MQHGIENELKKTISLMHVKEIRCHSIYCCFIINIIIQLKQDPYVNLFNQRSLTHISWKRNDAIRCDRQLIFTIKSYVKLLKWYDKMFFVSVSSAFGC